MECVMFIQQSCSLAISRFRQHISILLLDTIEPSLEYESKLRQTIRKLSRDFIFPPPYFFCGIRHCWQEILIARKIMCSKFTGLTS